MGRPDRRRLLILIVLPILACGDAATEPAPPPNRAPVASSSIPEQSVVVGETVTLAASSYFSDADGGALTYTASSSDPGVISVSVSGSMVTMVGVGQGTATITVTATDPGGLSATQQVAVTVPNRPPIAEDSIPARSIFLGETVTVDVSSHFSDPDGDALTYTANPSDPGVISVSVSGDMLTMVGVARGTADITVTATDPGGLSGTQQAAVTVPNRMPIAEDSIPAQSVFMGETVTVDVASYFSDPDGDTLTYTVATSDPGVISVGVAGSVVTIVGVARGTATMTVTATDPDGGSAMQQTDVVVPNRAPMAVGEMHDLAPPTGDTVVVDVAPFFDDLDRDELSYEATTSDAGVAGVSMSDSEAAVVGVSPGTATITITATDPDGLSAQQGFEVSPPHPGTVVGIILVAEDPTQRPGYGFPADFFGYMALLYRQGSPCDRPCYQVAVAMGRDTVMTDEYGRFVFENVRGDEQYRINVVEEDHPRVQRDVLPTTFWRHVMFDTVSVSTVWQDTVRLEMAARQVPILVAGVHRWPLRTGESRTSYSGITVTLFASDSVTVLDRKVSDEYGEVVFRPLRRGVTYLLSPVDGYDRTRYRCNDVKRAYRVGAAPYISCRHFDSSLTEASVLYGGGGVSPAGFTGHDQPPAAARRRRFPRDQVTVAGTPGCAPAELASTRSLNSLRCAAPPRCVPPGRPPLAPRGCRARPPTRRARGR